MVRRAFSKGYRKVVSEAIKAILEAAEHGFTISGGCVKGGKETYLLDAERATLLGIFENGDWSNELKALASDLMKPTQAELDFDDKRDRQYKEVPKIADEIRKAVKKKGLTLKPDTWRGMNHPEIQGVQVRVKTLLPYRSAYVNVEVYGNGAWEFGLELLADYDIGDGPSKLLMEGHKGLGRFKVYGYKENDGGCGKEDRKGAKSSE